MTLNRSKGRMFKSVGWTWNPVTGCTHDCRYCWAQSLTRRWSKSFTPKFRSHFLEDKMPGDGSWIFVGSMGDLFCPGMKDEWILRVIDYLKDCKTDNRFLLQTKNPFSFLTYYLELEQIRDKVILGTTPHQWIIYELDGLIPEAKPEALCDWIERQEINLGVFHKIRIWRIKDVIISLKRKYPDTLEIGYELKDLTGVGA